MTVRELIEALKKLPPELEVHTAYRYGDRQNRLVTPEVYDGPKVCFVKHSDYVDDFVMDADDDSGRFHIDGSIKVVVIQ